MYQIHALPDNCISCVAGTYSDVLGLSSCLQCGQGKFSTVPASQSSNDCANCGAGKYSSTLAANANSFCLNCVAGKYSTAPVLTKETDCQACGQGKYSLTQGAHALSFCLDCQRGTFSGALGLSTNSCTKCDAGKYSNTPAAISIGTCLNCQIGTYCIIGSATEATCPSNTSSAAQSISVTKCICKSGYFGSNGAACQACPTGKYKSSSGSGACSECVVDTYSELSAQTSIATCQRCPLDSSTERDTAQGSVDNCVCDQGHYEGPDDANAVWTCNECDMGTYKNSSGNFNCTKCPRNTYLTLFGGNFLSQCQQCTDHSSSLEGSRSNTSCHCNAGYYGNGQSGCNACPKGTYNSDPDKAECISCPAGKFSVVEGATEVGTCESCIANSHSLPKSTVKTACLCNAGFTGPNGGTVCNQCGFGTFKVSSGDGSCEDCGAGKYSATSARTTDCEECPAGTFSGKTKNDAVSDCERCGTGKFSDVQGAISITTCTFCDPGKYQMATGASSGAFCSECPVGKAKSYVPLVAPLPASPVSM